MIPEYTRFHGFNGGGEDAHGLHQPVYDADQRKEYIVHVVISEDQDMPSTPGSTYEEDQWYARVDQAKSTLKSLVDKLDPQVMELQIDGSGEAAPVVTSWGALTRRATYYPKLDEFGLPGASTKSILRSEITELDRLSAHVDAVSYEGIGAGEKAVFKYFHCMQDGFEGWQEINIHARLPRHPNIVPLHRLVLEEISGSRVVGFTMPFIASAGFDDFDKKVTPCFKLKHLKQLMQVVDDLNLQYGIVHQDIAPRNFFIDPATDDLVVYDFGCAAHLGTEHDKALQPGVTNYHRSKCIQLERDNRNDVKGVILALHEIITRDAAYERCWLHLMDEAPLVGHPEKWQKHPDVKLDAPARDYYDVLMAWVEHRRRRLQQAPAQATVEISHFSQAPRHFVWPAVYAEPPELSYSRKAAEQLGLPFVEWERPGEVHVDRTRRLLATGRYADEDKTEEVGGDEKEGISGKGRRGPKEEEKGKKKRKKSGTSKLGANGDRDGHARTGAAHDENRRLGKEKEKRTKTSRKQAAANAYGDDGQKPVLSQPVRRSARLAAVEPAEPTEEALFV